MGPSRSPSRAVVMVVMLAVLLASPHVASWRIDCTRFVYAPRCRGVAAKRGENAVSALSKQAAALEAADNAQALQSAGADSGHRDPDTFLQLLTALSPALPRPAPIVQRRKEMLDDFLSS
ncbi:uncharacterized protein LOC143301232 [Babylonia areolata]|uniref:uncharacterized protein LOC143301232 n=1 Tax=Babylonia areolata TaxID=304850 RepID=UPI003FD43805